MKNTIKATQILNRIWQRLKAENPKDWSLRKTAEKVGISPAYMSLIFSGKKQITAELAEKFLSKMDPALLERNRIRECFRDKNASDLDSEDFHSDQLTETYLVPATAEWLLGKWYRLAILDLLTTDNFSSDLHWISQKLGISTDEVSKSLQYFKREGLAALDSSGNWSKTYTHIRFPANTSREAIRNYHRAQLKRIDELLVTQVAPRDYSRRLVIGISAAVNMAHLEKVKVQLESVLYRAAKKLSTGKCTEVYQLSLQLVPYTKQEKS